MIKSKIYKSEIDFKNKIRNWISLWAQHYFSPWPFLNKSIAYRWRLSTVIFRLRFLLRWKMLLSLSQLSEYKLKGTKQLGVYASYSADFMDSIFFRGTTSVGFLYTLRSLKVRRRWGVRTNQRLNKVNQLLSPGLEKSRLLF